jgi:hypothetical protein
MAITIPTTQVLMLCTINDKTSPAMLLIDAASPDSLEPIAPLENLKNAWKSRNTPKNSDYPTLMYQMNK